jgi:iron(III) transport system substrate-binding protein
MVAILNGAPHPNAARLFVNWIASKEGMETMARAQLAATTRNDVDESFLPPEEIPRVGSHPFDSSDFEFTVNESERIHLRIKELLKAASAPR